MGYHRDHSVEMLEQREMEHTQAEHEARPVGARLAGFKERISGALASLDKGRLDQFGLDSGAHLDEVHDVVGEMNGFGYPLEAEDEQATEYIDMPESEDSDPSEGQSFPVGRLGYNRAAVDARIAELEAELAELRAMPAQPSITEEIERLGEQTASILVVAHDQANQTTRAAEEKARETTRLAQEQADRCIADAASNAVAITEKAKRELRVLDEETDTVWQERTRLLEDARTVGQALITLAEEATARFPAEGKPATPAPATPSFPPPAGGF
ncbi:MAG TPA: DivIVA domain-containing protein [Solirubrobacteraceae bacterium]